MKTLLIAILAGGAAGVGGSFAVRYMAPDAAPSSDARPASQGVTRSPDELAGLRSELAALRQRNEQLETRIAGLELGPRESRSPAAESDDLASLRSEVEGLLLAMSTPDAPAPASLQTAVRRTLEDVRAEEGRQRELEREQERVQRLEQRVDRMLTDLELAPYQVDGFRNAMAEADARRDAAMAQVRDSGDWTQARDLMRDLRDQSEAAMSAVLTTDQLEKYNELQNPRRFGGGGGDFGGGGGGRGNRGGAPAAPGAGQ